MMLLLSSWKVIIVNVQPANPRSVWNDNRQTNKLIAADLLPSLEDRIIGEYGVVKFKLNSNKSEC